VEAALVSAELEEEEDEEVESKGVPSEERVTGR